MKFFATTVADQNLALFDPWTVIHTAAGLFAGLVGIPFVPSIAAAIGYEVFEQMAESRPWGQKIFRTSGAETKINLVSDVIVFGLGWWWGDYYHRKDKKQANPAHEIGHTIRHQPRAMPARPRAAAPRARSTLTQRQFQRAISGRP